MGSSPYGARNLVAVIPCPGVQWKYGFPTNTSEAQRTVLGQVPAIAAGGYIPNLVLGANAPKPAKLRHYRAASATSTTTGGVSGGFDTSFCDVNKIDSALAAGWKIVSKYKRRRGNGRLVYVTISAVNAETGQPEAANSIKYAWNMPEFLRQKITNDLTELGIKVSTGSDLDLVVGARYPKPPRAVFKAVSADGHVGTRSTYVDSSKIDTLPSGWKPVGSSD
jgi:hypothetical protein